MQTFLVQVPLNAKQFGKAILMLPQTIVDHLLLKEKVTATPNGGLLAVTSLMSLPLQRPPLLLLLTRDILPPLQLLLLGISVALSISMKMPVSLAISVEGKLVPILFLSLELTLV